MATMKEFPSVLPTDVREPRKSTWAKFKNWCGTVVVENPLLQALCCLDAEEVEFYQRDQDVRAEIRKEMRSHMGYGGLATCVSAVMDTVYRDTGYDLGDHGTIRKANEGVTRTAREWDAYFTKLGVNPLSLYEEAACPRVCVVPKFAAAVSLEIRTRLGKMQANEANMLLVQRKYLEICRRHGVRDSDTIAHQQFVMNTVFTEDVLDHVASVRKRMPAWLRWATDTKGPVSGGPTVC